MKNIFKKITIILAGLFAFIALQFLAPVPSLAQVILPGELNGILVIDEKPVEFNYLGSFEGTTEFPYYSSLPDSMQFLNGSGIKYLSLNRVKSLKVIKFTGEESEFLRLSCQGCTLYKATIRYAASEGLPEATIYLAIRYLYWMNTASGDFDKLRAVDLQYVDEIEFRQK